MAKFGQLPVNNTAQAERARVPVAIFHDGEQRLDRRPFGRIERFVDPVGNVITVQMAAAGDPHATETANRKRLQMYAEGWVEHTRCPFKHGTRAKVTGLEKEFRKAAHLGGECDSDPAPMKVIDGEKHANKACDHIEWLITARREREAAQAEKRNAARVREEKIKAEAAELQKAQIELVKEQIEERKARKTKAKAGE
jgi:hypothetical protein